MAERHSEFVREADDHYVEPSWVVDRLLAAYPDDLARGLHDPCCGFGTIPDQATKRGFVATGADLIDRAKGRFPVQNFLTDPHERPNIVSNPPFKIAEVIVERALRIVAPGGIVAMVAQAKFLFSQARHPLFARRETERVLLFSKRPSMPPGWMLAEQGESCRGGGAMDYCWVIWRSGKLTRGCAVEWSL